MTTSITKIWSDPKVNSQIDKISMRKLQDQYSTERKHAPNTYQIQNNLPK